MVSKKLEGHDGVNHVDKRTEQNKMKMLAAGLTPAARPLTLIYQFILCIPVHVLADTR